jgi:CBS domain-containing protein
MLLKRGAARRTISRESERLEGEPVSEEDAMTVKAILDAKGHDVLTLGPNEKLSDAIRILADKRIGALVITNGDRKIVGILSERDIVRVIAKEGAAALDLTVRAAMTPKVKICNENHTVNELMEIMTTGRFRHLPVEKDGLLYGIVSIGDVVKKRIEDIEREAEEIKAYIATA